MSTPRKMLIVRKTPWPPHALACVAVLAICVGCEEKAPAPPKPAPRTSVALHIGVVEDAALAEAIRRLRGEWSERSGGALHVVSVSRDELLTGVLRQDEVRPPTDLVVFPSKLLGELCEEDRLRPVRDSVISSEDLDFNDLFPLIRERVIVYGQRVMALPLGCPAPLMAFGADTTASSSWDKLPSRAELPVLSGDDRLPRHAYRFLARAVCYATHPAREAVLFDPRTMEPRIAEPPFLKAMREVTRGGKATEAINRDEGPALAIAWPVRPAARPQDDAMPFVGAAPLPGAMSVYSPVSKSWETVDGAPQRVAMLATSGRLIGVKTKSRNAASAFRLLTWLAGKDNARGLATASSNVANPRLSLSGIPDDWTASSSQAIGKPFARAAARNLQARRGFVVPRLVRIDEYLACLEAEVAAAAAGEKTAEDALSGIFAGWEALTEAVGRDRQFRAYRRHLGLDRYEPQSR
ncbi:MAG: hypothetical protein AAF589_03830 [Planctomycetota bacterium]